MSYLANYRLAAEKAIEVLEDSEITQAPIVLPEIINRYASEIKIVRYTKLMKENGLSLAKIIDMFRSNMGACAYVPVRNHFIIYYNDTLSFNWCRFTIAHELGHIFLEHHRKAGTTILSTEFIPEKEYKEFEKEANAFARNLLSPAPLALGIIDDEDTYYEKREDLRLAFSITESAANTRLDYIHRDLQDYNNEMKSYVERIHMGYDRTCSVCHSIVPKHAQYCVTCGSRSIYKDFRNNPLPAYIHFDNRGIFEHCVQCGNNDITPGANYCKICGTPIKNYCTGNLNPDIRTKHINPSTALFCGACGSRTFFNIFNVTLSKEEVPAMRYMDGVDYDKKTMKVKICPKCQNEEFSETAGYCRICGTNLFNYCEGEPIFDDMSHQLIGYEEQHKNPSNARFCETCGKPTLFSYDILMDYKRYQQLHPIKNEDDTNEETEQPLFMTLPDIPEELPFS